jgi:hypothetical protein
MASTLTTIGERIALCMVDCHESIAAGYWYTQDNVSQFERPCFLIFPEDTAYPNTTVDQEQVEQGFSIAYVGQIYNAAPYLSINEYEEQAREVAEASIIYLLSHPQLQFTNDRGLYPDVPKYGLNSVTLIKVDGRSAVSLFGRDGVEGEAFWGFTIDVTVTYQLQYETVGY